MGGLLTKGIAKFFDRLWAVAFQTFVESVAILIVIVQALDVKGREAFAVFAAPGDVEKAVDGISYAVDIGPIGFVDGQHAAIEDPGHIGHGAVGAMARSIERIDEYVAADAEFIAQIAGVLQLLLHGGEMPVGLAWMRFVCGNENRRDIVRGHARGQGIHGWPRHPAIGSGETAEFGDGIGVGRDELFEMHR